MEKKTSTRATSRARAAAPKPTKAVATKAAAPRKRATKAAPAESRPVFGPSHDQIAAFAYDLFERSGRQHGRAIEHWLEAESKLRQGLEV